jgi:hypothetical protein
MGKHAETLRLERERAAEGPTATKLLSWTMTTLTTCTIWIRATIRTFRLSSDLELDFEERERERAELWRLISPLLFYYIIIYVPGTEFTD